MSEKKYNILLTGSGCPGWYATYYLLNSKNKYNIFACDISDNTLGANLSKKHFKVPKGNDSNYINTITKIVIDNGIDIIIPLTDPELISLSKYKFELEKLKCKVLVSNEKTILNSIDKLSLYKKFKNISPKFIKFKNINQIKKFIVKNSDDNSCYIKLKNSYGSRGTKKVITDIDWIKAFSEKKPENFGNLFPIGKLEKLSEHHDFIVLENLTGSEYSIDCVFDSSGNLKFYGVREREYTRNGICHTAKFIVDEQKEFYFIIKELMSFLKFQYNINIQVKRDKKGKLKLLEINPRISGSLDSFVSIDYDLISISLNYLLNKNINKKTILTPQTYTKPRSFRVSKFL